MSHLYGRDACRYGGRASDHQDGADHRGGCGAVPALQPVQAVYKKEDGTCPPEILAMCDDIRSLLGMESQDCPRLE